MHSLEPHPESLGMLSSDENRRKLLPFDVEDVDEVWLQVLL